MRRTAVEWFANELYEKFEMRGDGILYNELFEQAKAMDKDQMLDFGEFIIDELEPMSQNREWVEERYNYFKTE